MVDFLAVFCYNNKILMRSMKNKDKHVDHRKVLHEWNTPEFVSFKRGKTWYIVAVSIMAALIGYAIFSGSITMAIAFVMVSVLFMLMEHKSPREIRVIITDLGIEYDRVFYPYHHINSFWIVYHMPYVRAMYLRISVGKRFKLVRIELDEQNPVEIRSTLIKEVPEIEGAEEPIMDILTRLLRLQ